MSKGKLKIPLPLVFEHSGNITTGLFTYDEFLRANKLS